MDELQKKYYEYQLLDQKIKQLQEHIEKIDEQLIELLATIQSISEFNELGEDKEILVPLSNGIFARGKLVKEDSFLVNVGASVVVRKGAADTRALLETQKTELKEVRAKLLKNMEALISRAADIEQAVSENV